MCERGSTWSSRGRSPRLRRKRTSGTLRFLGVLLAALLLAPFGAQAVEPDEVLQDPHLEGRARALSAELRCLVCQNQSIDDSNAPLARDLRLLVRERLKNGDSNDQVRAFVVARYGEFVLLRPPVGWHTLLLWAAPVLMLAAIAALIVLHLRARSQPAGEADAAARPLTPEERRRLEAILKDEA